MSRTYTEVVQEIEALKAEAEQIKRGEINDVIDRIKHAIEVYGLKPADLGFVRPGRKPGAAAGAAPKRKGRKAKPAKAGARGVKFRDGANVWGGRGPRPKWLRDALAAGKKLEDFAV